MTKSEMLKEKTSRHCSKMPQHRWIYCVAPLADGLVLGAQDGYLSQHHESMKIEIDLEAFEDRMVDIIAFIAEWTVFHALKEQPALWGKWARAASLVRRQ